MRLIIADHRDRAARALASRWGPERAALVTPADLSRAGWRHHVGGLGSAAAATQDRVVSAGDVDAVVVRLAAVAADDLAWIHPEDRGYAAAEMTAFLLAWLDARSCAVINRPTPGCLNGPAWRPEQWAIAAARADFEVVGIRRRVPVCCVPDVPPAFNEPDGPATGYVCVTVVGGRCLGPVHPQVAARALQLAADAGVALLAIRLTGCDPDAAFLGAHAWPDLTEPPVADALDAYVEELTC